MNSKLLSVSLLLPISLIGWSPSFASSVGIAQDNIPALRTTAKADQVKLNTQQYPPFSLAARDEEKRECRWLGVCDE